jgi:hypothetical protein
MLPNPRGFMNFFSNISSSQHYPSSLPFFQNYKHPICSPSFYHLLRLIILFLPKKIVGISIFKIRVKNYVRKKNPKWSEFTLLKKRRRKKVKEDPNSVVNGRFQCLMAKGRRRRNTFSPFLTFLLTNLT